MRSYIYEFGAQNPATNLLFVLPVTGFRSWRVQSVGVELLPGLAPNNARLLLIVRGTSVWDISLNFLATGEAPSPGMFFIGASPAYPNDGGAAGQARAVVAAIPNTVWDGGKEEITGEIRIIAPEAIGDLVAVVIEADPVLRARARGVQGVQGGPS